MNIIKITAFALAASFTFSVPSAGFAQQQTQVQDSAEQQDREPTASTEVICRRIAPPTGSRIGPRRICKTRYQWDSIRDEARQLTQDAQIGAQFGNE